MKSNICLLSIDKRYSRTISKQVAKALDMYYADVNALILFDISDTDEVLRLCGVNYLHKLETNKVKNVLSYDNTLFTLDFELLNQSKIKQMVQNNSLIVFLDMDKNSFCAKLKNQKLSKSDKQNQLDMFEDRRTVVKSFADIVVTCDGLNPVGVAKSLKTKLLDYYKGNINGNR